MFNIDTLRAGVNLKQSRSLDRISQNGQEKMYKYLSGIDSDSTYTAQNIKYIMELHGDIDWNKISDPSNALFSIGYSDQGNIIGLLTNTNALLQDMLIYCPLEQARRNLKDVLSIPVATNTILGKRYAVNGQSPLTFSLPVETRGHYKTLAVVIHKAHADQFKQIIKSIDLDALTEEDMVLIAKDLGFISRTQELAIDVAKDKTIEIVDTSEWVNNGIKSKNYWLGKPNGFQDWLAKDNLNDILEAKKDNRVMPEFDIVENVPEDMKMKVLNEVDTSESLAREVLTKAVKDYFNNNYKEMLLYSQETELNQRAKSTALLHRELSKAIRQVIMAYRSYMIDNIPKEAIDDKETSLLIRKQSKEKTAAFANICRNTIYALGRSVGCDDYTLSLIAYGSDLIEVSKDEGKYFRAIMPEEFKKLYAKGKKEKKQEPLFYVDDFIKDMIDDGEEYVLDFKEGQAYDKLGILIAKASYKYSATNAKIICENGRYYAEIEEGVELPPVGKEVLVRIENISNNMISSINDNEPLIAKYITKTPNNRNLIFNKDCDNTVVYGSLGYRNFLPLSYKIMLLNDSRIKNMAQKNQYDLIETLLNDYDRLMKYDLVKDFKINRIELVNKDSEFESLYAIIEIK